MPTMNNPIWSSLWHRAAKEPIGIAFKVNIAFSGFYEQMRKTKPPELEGYTLSQTPDPNVFFITKPNAVIDDSIPD